MMEVQGSGLSQVERQGLRDDGGSACEGVDQGDAA